MKLRSLLFQKELALKNPLDAGNQNQLALIAFTSGQYDLAIAGFEALHDSAWSRPLALSYAMKRSYSEAIANLSKCKTNSSANAWCLSALAYVYGVAGNKREAKAVLSQLKEISHHHYVYPSRFALAYLSLDEDEALTWLERAYDEKDPGLFWLKVTPVYDPLRSEPRFKVLMRKLNFLQ